MIPPNFDSREAVSVIHSFMEKWSIIFFVILVICDAILHLFGEKGGPTWPIKWEKKTWLISWGKHSLNLRFPAYSSTLGLKSLIKLLGIISFALAISLEVIGYPYGKRNDELANKEIASSQAQASEALRKASVAAVQVVRLRKEAETERLERMRLEVLVAPRRLTLKEQQAIANSLAPFAGRGVTVSSYGGDTEAMVLGGEIASALSSKPARLLVSMSTGGLLTAGSLLHGIQVSGTNTDLRSAIESSLKNIGHLEIAGPEQKIVPEGSAFASAEGMTYGKVEATVFIGVRGPLLLPLP